VETLQAPDRRRAPAPRRIKKLRVFISYSREDLDFADQLHAALETCGFECDLDRHGIEGGERWKDRLGDLIANADTIAFVLSPASARSEICDREVDEAARLSKRILPVACRPLAGAEPPKQLKESNYIFFCPEPKAPGSGFGVGLAKLVAALNTDFDWLREHTRYAQRAAEWARGGRAANRLLSGDDIRIAKEWLARRPKSENAPEPTTLQLDFIRASEGEADARLAVVAGVFWFRAEEQRQVAERLRQETDNLLYRTTSIVVMLKEHMGADTKPDAFAAFEMGALHGDATAMRNLGVAYRDGFGVMQDSVKAREWFEKAAEKGEPKAIAVMDELRATEAASAGRYADALRLQETIAARDEAAETKARGGPGEATAAALLEVAWRALFARDFAKAPTVSERAHSLLPGNLAIATNRAHALMFTDQTAEARALYLRHKGKLIALQNGKLWERVVADDFAELRKAGIMHPMMTRIEKELRVSR
jgi:TPR repeat protein